MLVDRSLSPTTFSAGPDEKLITADVYTEQSDNVINSFPSVDLNTTADFSSADKTIADDLRGGLAKSVVPADGGGLLEKGTKFLKTGFDAIGGLKGAVKIATQVAGPSVLSRLNSGGGLTGIPGLPPALAGNLGNVLRQVPGVNGVLNQNVPNQLGSYITGVNGVQSRISPNNINTSLALSSLINSISNTNSTVVDKDATTNLIGGVSSAAIRNGVPNAFSATSVLAGANKDIIIAAANNAVRAAMSTGSVAALKDIGTTAGVKVLTSLGSSVLKNTASNYKKPSNATADNMVNEYALIRDSYQEIDPDWAAKVREIPDIGNPTPGATVTDRVIDITTIQNGSPDFLATMETGALNSTVPDEKYYALANAFPSESPELVLKRTFPYAATSVTSQTVPNEVRM